MGRETELRTERLLLRAFRATDVDDALAYRNDPAFARFLPHIPQPFTRADAEAFVATNMTEPWDTLPTFAVGLEDRALTFENRALMVEHGALMREDRAVMPENRAVVIEHRAGVLENRAVVVEDRAAVLESRVIGTVNLEVEPAERRAMLGYAIARAHWGRGITVEAARAVIAWAFATQPLDEIWASTHVDHVQSRRVMEKLGMTLDAAASASHPTGEVVYRLRREATGDP